MRSLSRSRGRKSCRLSRAEKRREEEAIQVLLYYYLLLLFWYIIVAWCIIIIVCVLLAGLVIQDQTSSNLNSLDTKVHHKDDQQTSKQEIGPYFGFGVSSATTKSTLSLFFTVGLLMMHWKFSPLLWRKVQSFTKVDRLHLVYILLSLFRWFSFLIFPFWRKSIPPQKMLQYPYFMKKQLLKEKRKRWKKHLCVCSSLCSLGNYAKLPLIELQPHIEEKL